MKILICGINFAPELTGIGKYTGELAEYLTATGHELRVVTAPPYYPQWRILTGYSGWRFSRECRPSMVVYRCPLWVPRAPNGLSRVLHLASFAFSSLWPMLLLSAWKPDVVISIAPAIFSAPAALLSAKLAGAKSWLHIQDFELEAASSLSMLPFRLPLESLGRRLESWLMRQFDRVLSISKTMLANLAKKGVLESSRTLLPNWVDTQAIRPTFGPNRFKAQLGINPHQTIALYSGNMGRKQGLNILIEAARQTANQEIMYVLCGDGAERARLLEQAAGLSNVIFLPLQPFERLNDLLNLADIHVLPQLSGAADLVMPSKLAGMLASGRPVIATADPGTELHAVVSSVGIVVQPGNSQELADAIRCLSEDENKRLRLGELGAVMRKKIGIKKSSCWNISIKSIHLYPDGNTKGGLCTLRTHNQTRSFPPP